MEYLIGLILAAATICLASGVGLGRDRSFYPTVLIVVGGIFLLFAVFGFKRNLWFVVVALIGHGLFDFVHHFFINNPGVPHWWPGFCLAFDALLGAFLAVRLIRHHHLSDAEL